MGDDGTVVYVLSRGAEELGQRDQPSNAWTTSFSGSSGRYGRGDGQFVWPRSHGSWTATTTSIATDDFLNRVSVFDSEGAFVSAWGEPGSGEGGHLNATGWYCLRHRWPPAGYGGQPEPPRPAIHQATASTWAGSASTRQQRRAIRYLPWGLCIDSSGAIYVADWKQRTGCRSSDSPTATCW